MADEAERSEWVHRNVDADLQFIFQESEVPEQAQYDLGQHYKSVRRFSALADDRAGVRQALQADFNLRADSAQGRAAVASVVAVPGLRDQGSALRLRQSLDAEERSVLCRARNGAVDENHRKTMGKPWENHGKMVI